MINQTHTLPFKRPTSWNAADDLFRVAVYSTGQIQMTFSKVIASELNCYAEDAAISASYGSDAERQWLDVSLAENGDYLGKLKNAKPPATLPLMVRGQVKKTGLSPVPHKFARCGGERHGLQTARVFLPPTFSPLAANTNLKVASSSPVLADFMKSFDKTDEELLNNFRDARCALEKRGHELVIEGDVIKMHISKTINI
jgi:hypothetical protein